MTLRECYAAMDGSYEDVVARLMTENLVKKFVLKFLSDTSFDTLDKALQDRDYDEAFRAAHTLKGICQNLSLTRLYESSARITTALRNGGYEEAQKLLAQVQEDYNQTISAIRTYQAEN